MPQALLKAEGGKVLVAIGANSQSIVGPPLKTVQSAIKKLEKAFCNFDASRIYETPSFPDPSDPPFINAACSFDSNESAAEVLAALHRIELCFMRERSLRWGQRTLDLDLIGYDDAILPDVSTFQYWATLPLETQKTQTPDRLILPHPRVQDRSFVLVPLADVAPQWRHPHIGLTVLEMLAQRPEAERRDVVAVP